MAQPQRPSPIRRPLSRRYARRRRTPPWGCPKSVALTRRESGRTSMALAPAVLECYTNTRMTSCAGAALHDSGAFEWVQSIKRWCALFDWRAHRSTRAYSSIRVRFVDGQSLSHSKPSTFRTASPTLSLRSLRLCASDITVSEAPNGTSRGSTTYTSSPTRFLGHCRCRDAKFRVSTTPSECLAQRRCERRGRTPGASARRVCKHAF